MKERKTESLDSRCQLIIYEPMCTCFYLVTYGRHNDGAWKVYREFIAPNLRFDYFSLSPSTVPPFGLSCIVSFAESSCISHLAVCGSAEELVFEKSVSSLRPFPNIFSRSSRRSLALSIATRVRARAVVHVSFRASVRAVKPFRSNEVFVICQQE